MWITLRNSYEGGVPGAWWGFWVVYWSTRPLGLSFGRYLRGLGPIKSRVRCLDALAYATRAALRGTLVGGGGTSA